MYVFKFGINSRESRSPSTVLYPFLDLVRISPFLSQILYTVYFVFGGFVFHTKSIIFSASMTVISRDQK